MYQNTKRTFWHKIRAAVLGVVVAASPITWGGEKLTIVSAGGSLQKAQGEAYFKPFEQATGIEVVQDSWNYELSKIRAMVETGKVVWDITTGDYAHAIIGCDENFLEEVDFTNLGDSEDYIKGTRHPCGYASDIFAMIFGYDANKFTDGPKTLADVFDTKRWPGKRGLGKNPKELLEQALVADGVSPDKVYEVLAEPEGVDRALAKIATIKDDIIWWETISQGPQLLADGEVVILQTYNGRLYDAAVTNGRNLKPIWDGQVYNPSIWLVPKGGNSAAAQKFIEFISEPKVQASYTNRIPYGPARRSAMQYVDAEMIPWLPTAKENLVTAISSDEEFWADYYEEIYERFQAWLANLY